MKKFSKKSSSVKPLVWFWNNFTGMFLGWHFSKIVREILIRWKTWLPWRGGDFLHYMYLKKFIKDLLWNRWSEFGIISQDCSLCDPFQKLFANIWSVKRYDHHWEWLFSLCGLQRNSPKPLARFWNNYIEMFLGWPFSKNCLQNLDMSINSISEWGLLALYKHIEILVNSSLKVTPKKLAMVISKLIFRWVIQGPLGELLPFVYFHTWILSGAYLQNYTSYGYEILWVDRSHQGGVQCT